MAQGSVAGRVGSWRAGAFLLATLAPGASRGQVPLEVTIEPAGAVEPAARLELSRALPLGASDGSGSFSVLVESPSGWLPTSIGVWTTDRAGEPLDQLGPVALELGVCPAGAPALAACARTAPLRLVASVGDREHPALREVAVLGRVGGRLVAETGGHAASMAIGGPRALGGAIHRVRTRVQVIRIDAGGQASLDADERRAASLAQLALEEAGTLWEQCGLVLGTAVAGDVTVIDPPRTELLEVGCRGGLPASGGQIHLETSAGPIMLGTRRGESAASVAGRLAAELDRRGQKTRVFENPPAETSAGPSYDLLVTEPGSGRSPWPPAKGFSSTDPTLGVCWGELDLADGLTHFEDETAKAGTLEERTLLRGVMDQDPTTIDIVIVPYFGGRGRIGESFIGGAGASLENLVILDRAGFRATARSSTLAHELGHVLLAQPGHPDDFGLDRPERLMDADASDATAFGPRRLSLEECRRLLVEHGPDSEVPLLERWPPPISQEGARSQSRD